VQLVWVGKRRKQAVIAFGFVPGPELVVVVQIVVIM